MFKKIRHKSTVVNNKKTGYLRYPPKEDIYKKEKEEKDIDPEDPTKKKTPNEEMQDSNDLDVPGSELDDEMENIGSEDEENNYYSLGGDNNHEDTGKDEED